MFLTHIVGPYFRMKLVKIIEQLIDEGSEVNMAEKTKNGLHYEKTQKRPSLEPTPLMCKAMYIP